MIQLLLFITVAFASGPQVISQFEVRKQDGNKAVACFKSHAGWAEGEWTCSKPVAANDKDLKAVVDWKPGTYDCCVIAPWGSSADLDDGYSVSDLLSIIEENNKKDDVKSDCKRVSAKAKIAELKREAAEIARQIKELEKNPRESQDCD